MDSHMTIDEKNLWLLAVGTLRLPILSLLNIISDAISVAENSSSNCFIGSKQSILLLKDYKAKF